MVLKRWLKLGSVFNSVISTLPVFFYYTYWVERNKNMYKVSRCDILLPRDIPLSYSFQSMDIQHGYMASVHILSHDIGR